MNYYEILNVPRDASEGEIKEAFRLLSKLNHPDKHPSNRKEWATEQMQLLNEAYSVLSDPVKRKKYSQSSSEVPSEQVNEQDSESVQATELSVHPPEIDLGIVKQGTRTNGQFTVRKDRGSIQDWLALDMKQAPSESTKWLRVTEVIPSTDRLQVNFEVDTKHLSLDKHVVLFELILGSLQCHVAITVDIEFSQVATFTPQPARAAHIPRKSISKGKALAIACFAVLLINPGIPLLLWLADSIYQKSSPIPAVPTVDAMAASTEITTKEVSLQYFDGHMIVDGVSMSSWERAEIEIGTYVLRLEARTASLVLKPIDPTGARPSTTFNPVDECFYFLRIRNTEVPNERPSAFQNWLKSYAIDSTGAFHECKFPYDQWGEKIAEPVQFHCEWKHDLPFADTKLEVITLDFDFQSLTTEKRFFYPNGVLKLEYLACE